MGRILGGHRDVFRFPELHFFDRFWSRHDADRIISIPEARRIAMGLCRYHRRRDPTVCGEQAEELVNGIEPERRTAMGVFTTFLRGGAAARRKRIPLEKSATVFYIDEIVARLPEARIVDIIRDPRDVLLSQKRKWLARRADKSLRVRVKEYTTYHPITVSALWAATVRESDRHASHPQVKQVRYEDLLRDPEAVVADVYAFCGLDFDTRVLQVPRVGSSNAPNQRHVKGIDATRTGRWQEGGIDAAEVFLCEWVTRRRMLAHGYEPSGTSPDLPRLAYHLAALPIKTGIAFATHAQRFGNATEAIARRIGV